MTDVTTQRAEYSAALPSWTLAEDAAEGSNGVAPRPTIFSPGSVKFTSR